MRSQRISEIISRMIIDRDDYRTTIYKYTLMLIINFSALRVAVCKLDIEIGR